MCICAVPESALNHHFRQLVKQKVGEREEEEEEGEEEEAEEEGQDEEGEEGEGVIFSPCVPKILLVV